MVYLFSFGAGGTGCRLQKIKKKHFWKLWKKFLKIFNFQFYLTCLNWVKNYGLWFVGKNFKKILEKKFLKKNLEKKCIWKEKLEKIIGEFFLACLNWVKNHGLWLFGKLGILNRGYKRPERRVNRDTNDMNTNDTLRYDRLDIRVSSKTSVTSYKRLEIRVIWNTSVLKYKCLGIWVIRYPSVLIRYTFWDTSDSRYEWFVFNLV